MKIINDPQKSEKLLNWSMNGICVRCKCEFNLDFNDIQIYNHFMTNYEAHCFVKCPNCKFNLEMERRDIPDFVYDAVKWRPAQYRR